MTDARKLEIKWILYDVGNSAFTLLVSALLPIYFDYLVTDGGLTSTDATTMWAYAASAVTIIVAVLSPILGTFTDFRGMRRPFFFFSALIGVVGCAALGIPMPWIAFLAIFIITKIAYSTSLVFYDSMLADVADMTRVDTVSSQGYAWGYIGSCIPFIISIIIYAFSGLDTSVSMPIAFIINAVWWLAFTIPIAKSYKQKHYIERRPHAIRENFKRLFSVFSKEANLPNKKGIILFLIAFFLYIDGVYTVIDMATSFGTALGFDSTGLLLALLVTQFVAFPCALIFGKLAQKIDNSILIMICIAAYTFVAIFAIFMSSIWQFWVLAVMVGMFQGGVQALSRSYFTKIIPPEQSGCLFGILDIFGKGAAFLGTLMVGVVTQITGSVNLGIIPLSVLFIAGFIVFVFAKKENTAYLKTLKELEPANPEAPVTENAEDDAQ